MTTPDWLQDAIFYQIFPDRFANGDPSIDPANVQKWGDAPHNQRFQGGDLRGIIQRFDYLLELGVNAIYLNPIFQSPSNHRYNTSDYYRIDPLLGNMTDFQNLIELAHRKNVRVVLDGVFNHCGRGFFAFNDVLENEELSPYKDWFHVHRFPLEAFTPGDAQNYEGWWKFKSLPKLNTSNPQVRSYIFDVARYWIERGADGWRLDVPNEIDDDGFWAEFRQVVKTANREACLIGEIWTADPRWADDTHFDGLMNYPVRAALLDCLCGRQNVSWFADSLEKLLALYPRENVYAMYLPLGSHDTERVLTLLEGSLEKLKLAFLFQFAWPGAPAVYYGDEIGLEGGKDPDCRRAFPWDPAEWKGDLHAWVRNLVAVRAARASLRRGDYARLTVDEARGAYAFVRTLGDERTLVVMNTSGQAQELELPIGDLWPDGHGLRSLIDHRSLTVQEGKLKLSLPPWGGEWLG
jgi:cyclomaltodextrinase